MYIEAVVGRSLAFHTSNVGILLRQGDTAERPEAVFSALGACLSLYAGEY